VRNGLSAVLIAKDEAASIGRCLRSLAGLDQVVVLDTGSTDGTPEIARSLGADVRAWGAPVPFHFAKARNEALKDARHGWVLSVDADETLSDGSLWALRSAARGPEWARLVRYVDRDPAHPEIAVESLKTRLFRRDKFHWRRRVHERLVPAGPRAGPVTPLAGVSIEHHPDAGKGRRGRNLELLRLAVSEEPDETDLRRHLGQELMLAGDHAGAAAELRLCVDRSAGRDPDEGCLAGIALGTCLFKTGAVEDAVRAFAGAHLRRPDHRDPLFLGAAELMACRRIPAAADWLRKCLSLPPCRGPESFCLNFGDEWDTIVQEELSKCEAAIVAANKGGATA
jgi:Glycosyl transferase family 2